MWIFVSAANWRVSRVLMNIGSWNESLLKFGAFHCVIWLQLLLIVCRLPRQIGRWTALRTFFFFGHLQPWVLLPVLATWWVGNCGGIKLAGFGIIAHILLRSPSLNRFSKRARMGAACQLFVMKSEWFSILNVRDHTINSHNKYLHEYDDEIQKDCQKECDSHFLNFSGLLSEIN